MYWSVMIGRFFETLFPTIRVKKYLLDQGTSEDIRMYSPSVRRKPVLLTPKLNINMAMAVLVITRVLLLYRQVKAD